MNFSDTPLESLYQGLKNVVKQMYAQGDFQNTPYKFNPHFLRHRNVIGKDDLRNTRNQWFQESLTYFHNDTEIHQNDTHDTHDVSNGYIKKFKCKFSILQSENTTNAMPFVLKITLVKDQDESFTLNAEIKSPRDPMEQLFIFTADRMLLEIGRSQQQILDTFQNIYLEVPMCQLKPRHHQHGQNHQGQDATMTVLTTQMWTKDYKAIKRYYEDAELRRVLIVKIFQNYMSDDTIESFIKPAMDHNLTRHELFLHSSPSHASLNPDHHPKPP